MFIRLSLAVLAVTALSSVPALADQWEVIKLRGTVQSLSGGIWSDLKRGDMVPDEQSVRTLADGRVDLQRDQEVISLGASTQVQIHDRTGARYTTVEQTSGSVEVDAQVQNVQHFEVDTRFLAAVVKGTHFVVTADDAGASVSVDRGMVAVKAAATKQTTTLAVGQTASVSANNEFRVSGTGSLPEVLDADGRPVEGPAQSATSASKTSNGDAAASPKAMDVTAIGAPVGSSVGGSADTAHVASPSISLAKAGGQGLDWGNLSSGELGLLMGGIGILIGAAFGGIGFVFKRFFG